MNTSECRDQKILVTGASGYIGGRLVHQLVEGGYQVRVLVRSYSPEYAVRWPSVEIIVADALDQDSLIPALRGIDVAYYLIHSLSLGPQKFAEADRNAARNFREVSERENVKRIIYLGGLGDANSHLSQHLQSRVEVAEELQAGSVPVTILRAAVIIGSGSASYEIIKDMVRVLPVIFSPTWANNLCQPIAIRDVVRYLLGVLDTPETAGKSFDIGGKEVLSYEEMLNIMAEVFCKKKRIIQIPFSLINLSAYVTSLITPVPAPLVRSLFGGLKNEVVCKDDTIREFVPFETMSYRTSIMKAMTREELDRVHTRWSDSYPPAHELAIKLQELDHPPSYVASRSLLTRQTPKALFASVCKIGGKQGWYRSNWMWWLRGMIDRILLGVGSTRGRRSDSELRTNDVIDFWRVEVLEGDRLLLLRAEMKLPGKAWLEFEIDQAEVFNKLTITAYYDTDNFFGRIYWYMFVPFHWYIFSDLIKQIERRSWS